MAKYVDFEQIKMKISAEQCATMLNLAMRKSGAQLRSACPACKTGGDRVLAITPARNQYYCFADPNPDEKKRGGDVIGFVAHVQGISNQEAAEMIASHFGLVTAPSTAPAPTKGRKEPPAGDRGMPPLDYLDPLADQVADLGISPVVADMVGIGYSNKGYLRGRVGVPVYLPTGELLGYFGIAPGADVIFNKSIEERAANVVELRKKA